MATMRQLQIIEDLETAAKVIELEGIAREDVTIGLICERAGHIPQNVKPIVESLKAKQDRENLSRIKRVFEKAWKMPSFLEGVRAVHVSQKSEDASQIDYPCVPLSAPSGKERAARNRVSAIEEGNLEGQDEEWDAASDIRAILKPFRRYARERIIGTVTHSFSGGGEL